MCLASFTLYYLGYKNYFTIIFYTFVSFFYLYTYFKVIMIAPTIANKRIKEVNINHIGYTVYITLPIVDM